MARIRFDYEGLSCGIGDRLPRAQADNFIACLQRAGAGAASVVAAASAAAPAGSVRKPRRTYFQRRVVKGRRMPRSRSSSEPVAHRRRICSAGISRRSLCLLVRKRCDRLLHHSRMCIVEKLAR